MLALHAGVVVRTPELQTVHCRLRPSKLWRPQHQPRPPLPIPFPPKAEARRPFDIHYGWAGLDAGARSAPPEVMWYIIALWRHPCPLLTELSGHRRQSAIIVPPRRDGVWEKNGRWCVVLFALAPALGRTRPSAPTHARAGEPQAALAPLDANS